MEANHTYVVNQQNDGTSCDVRSESQLFSLKLKPHVVQQIINQHDLISPFNPDSISIEFLSQNDAILWIGDEVQYKMNISSSFSISDKTSTVSNKIMTSAAISENENQDEIYYLQSSEDNENNQLNYVGNVTNRLVPLQHVVSASASSSLERPSPRSTLLITHAPTIRSEESMATQVSSKSGAASKKSAKPKLTQISTNSNSSASTPENETQKYTEHVLVLRHLDWNVPDTAIRSLFSQIPIQHIFATPCSDLNVSPFSAAAVDPVAVSLDFYLIFQSPLAQLAYERNHETIKYYTVGNVTAESIDNTLPTRTSRKKSKSSNKNNNSSSSGSAHQSPHEHCVPASMERISVQEAAWAHCTGVIWTSEYPLSLPRGSAHTHSHSHADDECIQRARHCQERYTFLHALVTQLYSASLGSLLSRTPLDLVSLFGAFESSNDKRGFSPEAYIKILSQSINISTSSGRSKSKSSAHILDGKRGVCEFVGADRSPEKRMRLYAEEKLQNCGNDMFDTNKLQLSQSRYYFFDEHDDYSCSALRASSYASERECELNEILKRALETAHILLMHIQLSIVNHHSRLAEGRIRGGNVADTARAATPHDEDAMQSSSSVLSEERTSAEGHRADAVVFEQLARLVDALYVLRRA